MKQFRFVIITLAICAAALYFFDRDMFLSQLEHNRIYDAKTQTITLTHNSVTPKDYPLLGSLELQGAVLYGKDLSTDVLEHLPPDLKFLSLIDCSIDSKTINRLSRYSELEFLRLNSSTMTIDIFADFPHFQQLKFLRIESPAISKADCNFQEKFPKDCEFTTY